jgi:tetratricopeptide (TPR) repeat protein
MDDAIVITDNMYTTQGVKGIPDIFTHDTFYGFFKEAGKEQLVSGGRYRPFTLAMFAIERSLFGDNPLFSHLINVLLFAFSCMLLYRVLKYLFSTFFSLTTALSLAFITALLFTTHPIHSEVVANIKGRDEIMSLLGSLLALWYGLKWMDTKRTAYLVIALLSYFAALLSKENAVSLLVWFPAALYIFKKNNIGQSLLRTIPFFGIFILFFIIRMAILKGSGFSGPLSNELLNNPFLKWEDGKMVAFSFSEKMATVFYCLGYDIKLLFFPYQLTHDYYPRHIPIMQFSNVWVILSVLLNITLFIGTIWLALKKHVLGYAGLLYWIALLIVSNLFFPIGTNMGERFVYMSSIGFCLAIAFLLQQFFLQKKESRTPIYIAAVMALLFSIKTISRNPAWKSNLVLFETDISTSRESAKLNNAIGSEYIKIGGTMPDGKEKNDFLNQGIQYLEKAINIHPLLKNSFLNLGNAQVYLNKPELAIDYYTKALAIDPVYKDARNNMAIAYRTIGRQAGEKERNLDKSIDNLNKAYQINPVDYETLRLLGVAHGIKGEHAMAIDFFTKALAASKESAEAYYDLGIAYNASGNTEMGNSYINKAIQMKPDLIQQRQK